MLSYYTGYQLGVNLNQLSSKQFNRNKFVKSAIIFSIIYSTNFIIGRKPKEQGKSTTPLLLYNRK